MSYSVTQNMYYLAIVCFSHTEEMLLRFKYWMKEQFGCVVALKSPSHITLIPPFWLDEAREMELLRTLQSFKTDIDELEIHLEGFSHFGKKILFVQVKANSALEELKKQTENHFMQSFGNIIKKDDRLFHPHITIATRDLKPQDFSKAWEYFSKKNFSATFQSRTITLLKLSPGKWNIIGEKKW